MSNPATPNTSPNIYSNSPYKVKSVLVVKAYIVIASVTAKVRQVASKTIIGYVLLQAIATIQLIQKVNTPSSA